MFALLSPSLCVLFMKCYHIAFMFACHPRCLLRSIIIHIYLHFPHLYLAIVDSVRILVYYNICFNICPSICIHISKYLRLYWQRVHNITAATLPCRSGCLSGLSCAKIAIKIAVDHVGAPLLVCYSRYD